MSKKLILLVFGLVLIVIFALGGALFFGIWIPNSRSAARFPIRGVDVSSHQGTVDWNAVSKSGMRFVYLKATEGGDFQDKRFASNLKAAGEAGLRCGAYHFFSLKTQGFIQAQNFIHTVPGGQVSLPPAIDLEFAGNSSIRPSPQLFEAQLDVYLNAVRNAYHSEPVIYTTNDFLDAYPGKIVNKHPWVRAVVFSPGDNDWMFWQFTERGKVPGITSFVDMDVFNGNETEFRSLSGESLR